MLYSPLLKPISSRSPWHLPWRNGLLLRSTNWLGDALMTLPASWQLSQALPEACGFFVLCPKFLAPLWKACPWVDIVLPMAGKRISESEILQVRSLLAGVGVVFPNSFGSALDLWKAKIPARVGRVGRFRSLLLTHRLPEWPRTSSGADRHQLSWYLDLVSALAPVRYETKCPALKTDASLAERHGITGKGWLAIAPGAAYGPAKQWPVQNYLEVAKWHTSQGGRIVLVGTSREAEATAAIAQAVPGAIDLAGKTDMAELMALLAAADKAIANDSGAMHLAAAVGTPGVAIFGSTDPTATGPIGAPWRLLISTQPCRPCLQRTCPHQDAPYACLREITPQAAITELQQL